MSLDWPLKTCGSCGQSIRQTHVEGSCLGWLVVREGPFRYLKSKDYYDAYSQFQREAIRFPTRLEARRAMNWNTALHSSWPCRIVRLVRRKPTELCGARFQTPHGTWTVCIMKKGHADHWGKGER